MTDNEKALVAAAYMAAKDAVDAWLEDDGDDRSCRQIFSTLTPADAKAKLRELVWNACAEGMARGITREDKTLADTAKAIEAIVDEVLGK